MKSTKLIVSLAASTAFLAGCGGGNHDDSAGKNNPQFIGTIAVPNVTATSKTFSYDAGQIADGNLYLTDRNNKSVDVVNTSTNAFALITGSGATAFAGDGKTTDQSGPNSVQRIPNTAKIYATDVSSVKVIDVSSRQVTGVINILDANGLKTGNRADGSCLDKEDNILMTMSSADNFVTWIDATTDKVINRFDFPDHTAGLEVCVFDPVSKQFFVNNDATATNPDGELDAFPVASVKAGATPILSRRFPLPLCNPNGLDLGPGNDIIIACDASVSGVEGRPLITLILDRASGTILSKVPFGGSDLVAYDPVSNRYFLGSRNWQSGGVYSKTLPKNPVLGVIDAATRQALPPVAAGTGAHAVIVDSANKRVYVPYAPTAGSTSFATGGIGVYTTQ